MSLSRSRRFVRGTAGLLFTFVVVVMPVIQSLPDREFLRVLKVMDRTILQHRTSGSGGVWLILEDLFQRHIKHGRNPKRDLQ